MVNESFDTTTNRAGDKVNLPQSSPFAMKGQDSVEQRNSMGASGRMSTGSAGAPQYASALNPFQAAGGADQSRQADTQGQGKCVTRISRD